MIMSYLEDLIFITTNGIDISLLEDEDCEILDKLLQYLLENLPENMFAFHTEGRVSYDCNNIDGDISALIERHPEIKGVRRVVFVKENSEIIDKEKAAEFIRRSANFFGQELMEQLQ